MTSRKELLRNYIPMSGEVTIGDGSVLKIEGKGSLLLHISAECGGYDLEFSDVLHVPKLQDNLISQGCLDKKGMTITTQNGRAEISDNRKVFLIAHRVGTLYFITTEGGTSISSLRETYNYEKEKVYKVSVSTWHSRLGHLHIKAMSEIEPLKDLKKKTPKEEPCTVCIEGKNEKKSIPHG